MLSIDLDRAVADGFTWRDGDRTYRFGPGAIDDAPGLLGDGYTLITTARSRDAAPPLSDRAAHVHELPPGYVEDTAGDLLDERHRRAAGRARRRPRRRHDQGARCSAGHQGGRGPDDAQRGRDDVAAPPGARRRPVDRLRARADRHQRSGAVGLAAAGRARRQRRQLARPRRRRHLHDDGDAGSRLRGARRRPGCSRARCPTAAASPTAARWRSGRCCRAGRSTRRGTGCTTWRSQTMVRGGRIEHGQANSALLPHTTAALRTRVPQALEQLDAAIGEPAEGVARRFAALAGATHLRELGVTEEQLAGCAQAAARAPGARLHAAARRRGRVAGDLRGGLVRVEGEASATVTATPDKVPGDADRLRGVPAVVAGLPARRGGRRLGAVELRGRVHVRHPLAGRQRRRHAALRRGGRRNRHPAVGARRPAQGARRRRLDADRTSTVRRRPPATNSPARWTPACPASSSARSPARPATS